MRISIFIFILERGKYVLEWHAEAIEEHPHSGWPSETLLGEFQPTIFYACDIEMFTY